MERKKLKMRIKESDTQQWKEEMISKPSLQWYNEAKLYIGYDECYRNSKNSEYLAKARTNSLQLEEHLGRGKKDYNKTCKLYLQEEENLEHFLIKCPILQSHRNKEAMKPWENLDTKKQTAYLLFKDKNYERTGNMIRKMWLHRKELLKPP